MSEEITVENKEVAEKPVGESPKRPGRKPGSKNKERPIPRKDDKFEIIIEEMKKLKDDLEDTKKELAETKTKPASIRLEQNKKKRCNLPPYSGPTKRVKFMRNDQPENPMQSCLIKVIYNKEADRKELLDWKDILTPGRTYELPEPVVDFLNTRSVPTYEERPDPDKPRQTHTTIVGEKQRCYCVPA